MTRDGAPDAHRQLWLAAPAQFELKVAQTKAEAGADQFRLYCKGPEAAVPAGPYLIADGADSEIVLLRGLEGETATLAAPLRKGHSRSRPRWMGSGVICSRTTAPTPTDSCPPSFRPPVRWRSLPRRAGCWPA